MPETPPPGTVGENWFVLDFEAAYAGEPEPQPQPINVGGGGEFYERVTFIIDGQARLSRRVTFLQRLGFRRRNSPVETVSFPGEARLTREVSVTFSAERLPATRIIQMRSDEDELLLLL